jgi:hypothetical protein
LTKIESGVAAKSSDSRVLGVGRRLDMDGS